MASTSLVGHSFITTSEWLADTPECARTKYLAFIHVDRDFTGNLQLFKFIDTPQSGQQLGLGVVGYPGNKYLKDEEGFSNEAGAQMYEDFQYTDYDIVTSARHMIKYKVSTFGGQSGAPIIRRGNSIVAIGAHCYGGGGSEANSGNSIGGKYGNVYANYIALFARNLKTEDGRATIVSLTEPAPVNGQTDINNSGLSNGGSKNARPVQQLPAGLSKPVVSSGDTEGFLDILEAVGSAASVALPIAGSIFGGLIGGGIGTVAGTLLGYVSGPESALDSGATSTESFAMERVAPGAAERAVLAEAGLQAIVSLDHNTVSEKLLRDIQENFNRSVPRLDNLVICFKPVLTQHALNITVQGMNRTAGLSQNTAESGGFGDRADIRGDNLPESAFAGEGGALLEALLTPTLPVAGEEGWISSLGSIISAGARWAVPIAGNLAKEYAPGIINGLVGKLTGGSESTEIPPSGLLSDEATRFLFKRALLADASLTALQRLDKKELNQLRLREDIAQEHAQRVQEGAWGDFFKGAVQTIAPIALDAGKQAVASIAPKIINGVLNKVDLGGRSETAASTINGSRNGELNGTLRPRRSVLDMFNTANAGSATKVSSPLAYFEAPALPLASSSLQATLEARRAEWQPLSERRRSLDDNDDLPVDTIWIYESSTTANLIPVDRLREAIYRLLDYYPHLGGRLAIDSDTGTRTIDRFGAGMHLIEASCDASFRSFAGVTSDPEQGWNVYDFPGLGQPFLPAWDMSPEAVQGDPIFKIQRTRFACSAVSIGVRVSHVVTAAGGYLRLYQDLAEIYRGISAGNAADSIELSVPPHLEPFMVSFMVHMSDEEKLYALKFSPTNYSLQEAPDRSGPRQSQASRRSSAFPDQDPNQPFDPIEGRTMRFSPEQLAKLKYLATDPNNAQSRASTFTALTAHIWQRTHLARLANARARSENADVYETSTFGTSVDFCKHFDLPERSFGNTIITPVMELSSVVLETSPLWDIASAINDIVRHVSEDETRKLGKWIAAQPHKEQIKFDLKVTPYSFIATSWHRFPLYSGAELDVAPIFSSPASRGLFDGMVVMVESRTMDGGIDALVSVKRSTFSVLHTDKSFVANWD
ncbi:transferase family-domain-containing protein [Plectosphaerella cucumerina]|uniref:Transferase family-domain-containing protein n=1 Tax=Plectosphaerella cucumerina TaxID=40658 RepID=A0A8K0T6S2_9PEZI|nr:transferase family-domain-containing protein [Plectosphaerella cucumerina]